MMSKSMDEKNKRLVIHKVQKIKNSEIRPGEGLSSVLFLLNFEFFMHVFSFHYSTEDHV